MNHAWHISRSFGDTRCCLEHIQVIGAAVFDIGISMGSVLGMLIGTGMEEWHEYLECGLV